MMPRVPQLIAEIDEILASAGSTDMTALSERIAALAAKYRPAEMLSALVYLRAKRKGFPCS
jgi:hypothetical protein